MAQVLNIALKDCRSFRKKIYLLFYNVYFISNVKYAYLTWAIFYLLLSLIRYCH